MFLAMLVLFALLGIVLFLIWVTTRNEPYSVSGDARKLYRGSLDMAVLLKELNEDEMVRPMMSEVQRQEAQRLVNDFFGRRALAKGE